MLMSAPLSLLACMGLVACASIKPPEVDTKKLSHFEANAYPALHQFDTSQSEEVRQVRGLPMRLVWLRPRDAAPHSLVVYMPGAGQDARAFAHWRQTMAASGYVVLSWQPLPDDDLLPTAGGSGVPADLHQWAKQRFASVQMQARAELLSGLMQALTQAQRSGDVKLKGIDMAHCALAGYDLGAYTTMVAAGEQVSGVSPHAEPSCFKAFLVISPYASFEQGGFDTRYKRIQAPVLSITSEFDSDPFGLVSAPYLRTAPFGGMPAGNKFLLDLRSARHADLGEREGPERITADAADMGAPEAESLGRQGDQGRGASGHGHDRGGGRGHAAGGSGHGDRGGPGDAMVSPTARAMQRSAVESVSLAFLDANLQNDAQARQWLAEQAARWVTPIGDWVIK